MEKKKKGYLDLIETVVFLIAIVIVAITMCRGVLVDESKAVRALEAQGFSDIEITDKAWFIVGLRGCSEHDAVKFMATATNPVGKKVEVYVCSGWIFKGATIRTN